MPAFSGSQLSATLTEHDLAQAGLGSFFRPGEVNQLGITYDQLRGMEERGDVERVAVDFTAWPTQSSPSTTP